VLEYDWIKAFPHIDLNQSFLVVILEHLYTNLVYSMIVRLLTGVLYNIRVICLSQFAAMLLRVDLFFEIILLIDYFHCK
jgi:hypothetical protein